METGQAYAYTGDDPVNGVDPTGLNWYDPSWAHKAIYDVVSGLDTVRHAGAAVANEAAAGVRDYDPFYAALNAYDAEYHAAQDGCSLSTVLGDASRAVGDIVSGSSILLAPEAEAAETANEGVYVIKSSLGDYVGQSGDIDQRLAGYVSSGRFTSDEVAAAERTLVTGGKTSREVAEQMEIDSRGGVSNLLDIRNPIGEARFPLMPQPYARP